MFKQHVNLRPDFLKMGFPSLVDIIKHLYEWVFSTGSEKMFENVDEHSRYGMYHVCFINPLHFMLWQYRKYYKQSDMTAY